MPNQIKKWLKNEFVPILIGLSLMIISLSFIYYLIKGTIIIIVGGHHIFASTVWYLIIISTIYLLSLLMTQLWKNKKINSYEKIKPTIIYTFLISFISYLIIDNNNFILLTIIYIFATIGAITGYLLTKQYTKKSWKEKKNMQTFFIRYLKENIDKKTHQIKLEEKEDYILAENFGEAYKKAHEITGAYTIEVFDVNTIIHDVIILKNRIQFMRENETNYNSEFLSKFDKEFKKLEAEKNRFYETFSNFIFKK